MNRYTMQNQFRLLGVMLCVAAGFFLVLKIGFVIHHEPQPAPIDSNALTAASVLILGAGAVAGMQSAIRSVSKAANKARLRKAHQERLAAETRARQLRVAELAADPARAHYAPLVERGESWSDEQITYQEDPHQSVTCAHLQQIERAMRDAGIKVLMNQERIVTAQCRVDFTELQRALHAGPPVSYAELYEGNYRDGEYPTAYLICNVHKSIIHTLHPDEAGA